jgi:hypothetical protein
MAEQENEQNPNAGPLTQPGTSPSSNSAPPTPEQDTGTAQPTPPVEEYTGPEPLKGDANVRLAKSKEDMALQRGVTNIGMKTFILPDKEGQLAGFYVKDPGGLVNQFPQYKYVKPKAPTPPATDEGQTDTTEENDDNDSTQS